MSVNENNYQMDAALLGKLGPAKHPFINTYTLASLCTLFEYFSQLNLKYSEVFFSSQK